MDDEIKREFHDIKTEMRRLADGYLEMIKIQERQVYHAEGLKRHALELEKLAAKISHNEKQIEILKSAPDKTIVRWVERIITVCFGAGAGALVTKYLSS